MLHAFVMKLFSTFFNIFATLLMTNETLDYLMRKVAFISFFLLLMPSFISSASLLSQTCCGIIPEPRFVDYVESQPFELKPSTKIFVSADASDRMLSAVKNLTALVEEECGVKLYMTNKPEKRNAISLLIDNSLSFDENEDQGYILEVDFDGIVIKGKTETGLFYGIQSLKQMVRKNDGSNSFPALTVTDYPALAYRGWMDDISRGPISTMDYLKRVIAVLSEYKLNFFNLYTEQVFKLNSHPGIAPVDGISREEIKELEEYAAEYFVTLIGNQQCFAHAEKTLSIPAYSYLMDTKYNFNPAIDETYEFLEDVFSEVAPAYSSPLFNINCDETSDLGKGKAKEYVDSVGVEAAYYGHINKVNSILKRYDKRLMMWGDIAAKYPEIIPNLPSDLIVIAWSYVPSENFVGMIEPFQKKGMDFMIAPGVSCWGRTFPDISSYMVNIANFVRDGNKLGAMGMMNTAWDDDGENFFNNNWHGMIWGAEMSWNPILRNGKDSETERKEREEVFNDNFNVQFFGVNRSEFDVVSALYDLDGIDTFAMRGLTSDGQLWKSLTDFYPADVDATACANNATAIEDMMRIYDELLCPEDVLVTNGDVLSNARFALKRSLTTARVNALRQQLYKTYIDTDETNVRLSKAMIDEMLVTCREMREEYARLWMSENRGFALDRVLANFDAMSQSLLDVDKRVFISTDVIESGKQLVYLRTLFNDKEILFSLDGSNPHSVYSTPFVIGNSLEVKACTSEASLKCGVETKFILSHKGIASISRLNSRYSTYNPSYSAGGDNGLADGILSTDNYADGKWQGYQGQNVDIDYDFGKKENIHEVVVNFYNSTYDWIMAPETVRLYSSEDGIKYEAAASKTMEINRHGGDRIVTFRLEDLDIDTRYMKFVAEYPGDLPQWHQAPGEKSYIFVDEIVIR